MKVNITQRIKIIANNLDALVCSSKSDYLKCGTVSIRQDVYRKLLRMKVLVHKNEYDNAKSLSSGMNLGDKTLLVEWR